MIADPRPISITILACPYLAFGIMGFAYRFREVLALRLADTDLFRKGYLQSETR